MIEVRKAVALLSVSSAALLGIYGREGFAPVAVAPLPGDVATYGYGSTRHADGSPVTLGEAITEPEARALAEWQVKQVYETGLRRCTRDLILYPREWDFLVDAAYNLGTTQVCNSGMVRHFRKGDYAAGCAYILKYTFFQGKDCRVKANRCSGIPKDRERAYRMCVGQ